jgi:hypothetical protein
MQVLLLPLTGIDLNIAEVDLRFRVLIQLKTGKADSKLKFTINCYHTSTSILVNDSNLDLFIENILLRIKEAIAVNCNDLNELNYRIENSIDRNIKHGQTEQQQITTTSPKRTPENEEPIRTNQMEMITYKDMETEIESKDICPVCQKHAEGDTIECKQCIDDHLYQLPKDIDETIVLETKQKNKTRAKSNCHSPVSTGFSELYWSYKWH